MSEDRLRSPRFHARHLYAVIVLVATASGAVVAQKNPFLNYTEQKFAEDMQAVGRNYPVVKSQLAKNDFETAKAQLTRVREHLGITITYWRDHKNDDAIKLLRNALNRIDELDDALSAVTVDAAGVRGVTDRIDAACQACHAAYREQDPAKKTYRIKTTMSPVR